jgi:hypothetical protein
MPLDSIATSSSSQNHLYVPPTSLEDEKLYRLYQKTIENHFNESSSKDLPCILSTIVSEELSALALSETAFQKLLSTFSVDHQVEMVSIEDLGDGCLKKTFSISFLQK